MAKKSSVKKEALQSLSASELTARLREATESRFRLEFRHAGSPLKNPMEIRRSRREIARLKTFIRQKAGTA